MFLFGLLLMVLVAEVQIKSTDSTQGIHTASLILSIFDVFPKLSKHLVMNMHVVCSRERKGYIAEGSF